MNNNQDQQRIRIWDEGMNLMHDGDSLPTGWVHAEEGYVGKHRKATELRVWPYGYVGPSFTLRADAWKQTFTTWIGHPFALALRSSNPVAIALADDGTEMHVVEWDTDLKNGTLTFTCAPKQGTP
jgi:hypothetical protein